MDRGRPRRFSHPARRGLRSSPSRGLRPGPGSHPRAEVGSLTERIREYDRKLEEISKESYPETSLLRQVEGIAPLTALTFVLSLEDPYRFEKSRSAGAYLGLVPARDQSGDSDPQKRISKEGDQMLRKLLVGSAHYILGPFGPEFRAEAVRLVRSATDKPVSQIARELGVSDNALRSWIKQAEIDQGEREGLTTEEREELSKLRKELKILRQEREILKKATVFFAREEGSR